MPDLSHGSRENLRRCGPRHVRSRIVTVATDATERFHSLRKRTLAIGLRLQATLLQEAKVSLGYTEWRPYVVYEQVERFLGVNFSHIIWWHTGCLFENSSDVFTHRVTAVALPPSLLIVDDYPDALDVWGLYLRAEGFNVLTAADGQSALAEAVRQKPDVIVMDLELPGKSGFEVARELKARPDTCAIL